MTCIIVMAELGKVYCVTVSCNGPWSSGTCKKYFKTEADANACFQGEMQKASSGGLTIPKMSHVLMLFYQGEYYSLGEPLAVQ